MSKVKTLHDLLIDQLQDLYYAEKKIVKTLPKLSRAATEERLKRAFDAHRAESVNHVERLEQMFAALELKPRAKKCEAIEGILAEGAALMEETADQPTSDAALIASAQRVEHYEIAAYGCARAYAEQLGFKRVVQLINSTIGEEGNADKKLTELSTRMNAKAMAGVDAS